jgi:hypothetical protein
MLVAETLLRRAEVFRNSAVTVKDFIKGAVLAGGAVEMLAGKTPTLTISALVLMHDYEARAECAFVGVGYHFDVKRRAAEIAREVQIVSGRFARRTVHRVMLDARVVIMNRLAKAFREAGQFEEEQECLVQVRHLHRKLTAPRNANPAKWAVHWLLVYAEWLLESFNRFVAAIVAWLIVATYLWLMLAPGEGGKAALSGAWGAFFGGNTADAETAMPLLCVSCFVVTAGLFHVGVFISYLYSLISRR